MPFAPPVQEPIVQSSPFVEPHTSMMQRLGFWVLLAYLLSGNLNDLLIHVAGSKAYLSVITLFALRWFWLTSGVPFRGLRVSTGWWWTAFLGCILLATPFSIWRGGSVQVLTNYIPRAYMLLFFVATLVTSVRKSRQLMYVNIAVSFMVLLTCIAIGSYGADGRYFVRGGAGFYENSNELGMELLLGIIQFVYLFSQGGFLL